MYQAIAVLLLAIATNSQPSDPVLLEQRLYNAEVWIVRSNSAAQMDHAFSPNVTDVSVGHAVVGVGYYKPKTSAYEYDSLVTLLPALFGYAPVILQPRWDKYTIQWNGTDILFVDYFADIKTDYNFATGGYNVIADNIRYRETIKFIPGTPLISDGLTFPEPAETKIFESLTGGFTPEALCYGLIFPACENTPWFADIEYTNPIDCVQFLYSLSGNRDPFDNSANTSGCRQIHATLATIYPAVHCEHVSKDSSKCRDFSNGLCNTCHQFAVCTGDVDTYTFKTTFGCKCKPGFKGDGFNCVPQNCTADWQCDLQQGSGACVNKMCTCADSFTWDAVNAKCVCPAPNKVFWTNRTATCHRPGRCSDDWQCRGQLSTDVKCRSVGNNIYVEKACLCNRGFNGGVEYPCVCDGGRKVNSRLDDGNICIKGEQCTENWHCKGRKICVGATTTAFGVCQ